MSTPDNIPTEQDDGNKNSSDMCSDNSDDDAVEHHQRHRDKNIDDEKTGSIKNKVAMTDKPLSPKFKSLKKCNRKPKPSQPDIVKDANVVDDNRVNTTLKTDDNRTFSSSTESPKTHTLAPKTSTATAAATEETVKVENKIFVSRRKKEETKDDTDAATAKAKVTTVKATTDDESSTEEADDNRTFSSSTESPKTHTLAPKTSTATAAATEETVKVENKIFVSRRKKEETKDDTDAATAKAKVTTVKATTDDESSTEEADNDKGASGNHIASIETHGRKSGNDSKIDNTADVVQKMKTLQPAPVSVSKMAAASAAAAAASLRTIRGSQQGLKTAPPAPSISTKRVIASISAKSSTPSIASKSSKKKKILDKARRQSNLANSNNTDLQRSSQFPFRLHNMLDDADREGHSSIVSWCAGGNSFRIHQPKQMITVLQRYFRQSKFKSFLRQLQGYNFNRITKGKDQGIVSHPMFIRGRRSICALMKRKRAIDSIANATTSTASVDGKSLTALSKSNAGLKRIKKNPDTKKDTKTSPSMTRTGIKQISPKLCGNISEINGIGVPIVSSTTDYRISQQQWQQRGQTLPQQQQQNPLQFNQPVSTTLHQPPIHLQRESSENGMQFHQHRVHQHYQPSTYAPMKQNVTVKPDPQDVLCVNVPNVQHFQGNRKLHSIVQKITSHYFSATDSVKSMIVNEISSRIQNGGSRFLKLAEDGSGWIKCNEQEIFRQGALFTCVNYNAVVFMLMLCGSIYSFMDKILLTACIFSIFHTF